MSVPAGYSGYYAVGRHGATDPSGEVLNGWSTSASIATRCDPTSGGDLVTIEDITAIYGAAYDTQEVRDGLPSLNAQMKAGGIDNPRRCAAFLATLKNESGLRYSAVQAGASTYRGRGFIQLTGIANYSAAGTNLGHSLLTKPGDAATLAWSARVARWYWTVNRPGTNAAADNLDMGLISKYIGYAFSTPEDLERCADFKTALQHFTGSIPTGINCLRPWTPLRMYQVGQQVSHNGLSYECLQQHISLTGVQPPNTPALWKAL